MSWNAWKIKEKYKIQQTWKNSFFKTTERISKFVGVLKSYRNVVSETCNHVLRSRKLFMWRSCMFTHAFCSEIEQNHELRWAHAIGKCKNRAILSLQFETTQVSFLLPKKNEKRTKNKKCSKIQPNPALVDTRSPRRYLCIDCTFCFVCLLVLVLCTNVSPVTVTASV